MMSNSLWPFPAWPNPKDSGHKRPPFNPANHEESPFMKKLLTAALISLTLGTANAQTPPAGYVQLTTAEKSNVTYYINPTSVRAQRFVNTPNPARLAVANFWASKGVFARQIFNCDNNTFAQVEYGPQGQEFASTNWNAAIDGTVIRVLLDVTCSIAYQPAQTPDNKPRGSNV